MQSVQATTMRCWILSVLEAIETRRHIEKLNAEIRAHTIFKYFPVRKKDGKPKAQTNLPESSNEEAELLHPIFTLPSITEVRETRAKKHIPKRRPRQSAK